MHIRLIKAYYNIFIRSVITSFSEKKRTYRIKRVDKYFASFGFVLVAIYGLYILNIFDLIYYYTDIPVYYETYDNLYSYYLRFESIIKNTFLVVIPLTILEEFFLKRYYKKLDIKPGRWKKHKLRKKAIKNDKIYVGSRSNKSNSKFISNLPWKKHLFITDEQKSLHANIVGTTGTGKSESANFPWLYQEMKRGKGAIIIDSKGDMKYFKKIYTYHKKFNKENDQNIYLVNIADPENSNTYNPYLRGSSIELKDRNMSSFDWDNEFFESEADSILLTFFQSIEILDKKATFKDIYKLLSDKKAIKILRQKLKNYKEKISNDERKIKTINRLINDIYNEALYDYDEFKYNTKGLRNKMKNLAYGGFSQIVNTYCPDVDLLDIYKNNDIVYFMIPVDSFSITAKLFGRLLLSDLKSTAGYILRNDLEKKGMSVYVDEPEFLTDQFISWLNKTRGTYSVSIAHQSLGDLKKINESFMMQIIDNTNLKMVFRGNDPSTAEYYADQLGTYETYKETERVSKSKITESEDYVGSLRKVKEYIENPNKLKQLKRGQALIFGKHPEFFHSIINTDYLEDPEEYLPFELYKPNNKGEYEGLNINIYTGKENKEVKNKKGDNNNESKDEANESKVEFAVEGQ